MNKNWNIFISIAFLLCGSLQASYQDYLIEYFQDRPFSVTPLAGGYSTARNYKVTAEGEDYAFRLLEQTENRLLEIVAAVYAGERGIGPPVFYVSSDKRAMLMGFVKGETLDPQSLQDPETVRTFLQLLRRLHQSTGEFPKGVTQLERLRYQLEELKKRQIPLPMQAIDRVAEKLNEIEQRLRNHPLVPCHNDLNPRNILVSPNGTFQLIDWTDAGMGYAYGDLGFFAITHLIAEERGQELLASYAGTAPSQEEIALLRLMKRAAMLRIFIDGFLRLEPSPQLLAMPLDERVLGSPLPPLSHFLKRRMQGETLDEEQVITAYLSALQSFLNEDSMDQVSFFNRQSLDSLPLESLPEKEALDLLVKTHAAGMNVIHLQGGRSAAHNYRVTAGAEDYVLRFLPQQTHTQKRELEIAAAVYAGERGIGPPICYIGPERRAVLMAFVKGETFGPSHQENEQTLRAFAHTLRRLHESKGYFPKGVTHFERIRNKIAALKQSPIPFPVKALERALAKLDNIEQLFANQPLVPCHHDLNPRNLMVTQDGTIQLIDWTDAGMGYAYGDLGHFAFNNLISEERYPALLVSYLDTTPSQEDISRLKAMKKVAMLRSCVYGLFRLEPARQDRRERELRAAQMDELVLGPDLPMSDKDQITTYLGLLQSFLNDP